jgi:hypothetical protein
MPALVIASFPLITFFGNLYYTDVASLAGVLGAWTLAMKGQHSWASLVRTLAHNLNIGVSAHGHPIPLTPIPAPCLCSNLPTLESTRWIR